MKKILLFVHAILTRLGVRVRMVYDIICVRFDEYPDAYGGIMCVKFFGSTRTFTYMVNNPAAPDWSGFEMLVAEGGKFAYRQQGPPTQEFYDAMSGTEYRMFQVINTAVKRVVGVTRQKMPGYGKVSLVRGDSGLEVSGIGSGDDESFRERMTIPVDRPLLEAFIG